MLFVLFKIKDIPEYSTLSELSFVLDKDNFLNLCEYFGGLTIKIPTLDELQSIVYSLMLYQYINVEGKSLEEALKLIENASSLDINIGEVKATYFKVCELMDNYTFGNE